MCKDDSEAWAEKLRRFSIKYRKIDYDWQLTERDWSVLFAYIYANRILIDCLQGNSEKISKPLEQFIMETLLSFSAQASLSSLHHCRYSSQLSSTPLGSRSSSWDSSKLKFFQSFSSQNSIALYRESAS